ncbi:MAG: hypothetical protein ACKO0W_08545, partial [Planctomycetota bacterium]
MAAAYAGLARVGSAAPDNFPRIVPSRPIDVAATAAAKAREREACMGVPLSQMWTVASYVL